MLTSSFWKRLDAGSSPAAPTKPTKEFIMLRKSTVRIKFDKLGQRRNRDGNFVEVIVRTNGMNLSRDEAQEQHAAPVDKVVDAVRHLPYVGTAPLRSVEIR
jgi:hypothetical protein